jgi:SAM-dependent methyltransferase
MARQRLDGAAPVALACAEALPISSRSFDAVLAVNTLHHWKDVRAGVREMRRVARQRVVILHRNPAEGMPLWLTEKYFPTLLRTSGMEGIRKVVFEELPCVRTVPVALPADCQDGLFSAFWARPEAYLDEGVRRNISNFALADPLVVEQGLEALRRDLESGAWDREHGHLRRLPSLDLGHRILVAELSDF